MKKIGTIKLAILGMTVIGLTATVSAESTTVTNYIKSTVTVNGNNVVCQSERVCDYLSTTSTDNDSVSITLDSGGVVYYSASKESILENQINKLQGADDIYGKIDEISDGFNIAADIETGAKILSGFAPFIGTMLGVFVIVITNVMTVLTAVDICFIAFPMFRNFSNDVASRGGAMSTTSSSTGESKMRLVSDDAVFSVREEVISSGKSAIGIYFKRRAITLILVSVALFVLLTNNMSLIIRMVIMLVQGLLDIFTSFL